MIYAGYARVSTEGQKDTSIEVQIEYLKLQAERLGYQFKSFYEKASGKNTAGRAVFTSLLNTLENGDILGVYDNSRLGRNTQENLSIISNLNARGVQVQINGKIVDLNNPQDKLLFSVESAVSTYQRESQLLKSKAGQNQKKKNGDWVMCGHLWGWNVIRSRGKTIATIDETAAKYIRFCYTEYLKGRSFAQISEALKDVVDTKKRFTPDAIRQLIRRPIYMGYYTIGSWKDIEQTMPREQVEKLLVKSNIYPPIVDEETWWEVRKRWRFNKDIFTEKFDYRYSAFELTGVLKCGGCGTTIYHAWYKWRNKSGQHVKSVYIGSVHKDHCPEETYRKWDLDYMNLMMRAFLFTTLKSGSEIGDFFKDKRVMLNETAEALKEQLAVLEKEKDEIEVKIGRVVDAISDGILTTGMAKSKIDSLRKEQEKIIKDYNNVNDAYLINQGELDDVLEDASANSIDEFIGQLPNGRKKIYVKYLKYAKIYKDHFDIEFMNGKRFVVTPWEAKKINKPMMTFFMYFNSDFQASGRIDLKLYQIQFDEEKTGDIYKDWSNSVYSSIAKEVNSLLEVCRNLDDPS